MSEPVTTKAPGRRRMYLLVRMLCEGGLMIALALVLGLLKVFELPQGGSISLEMLPLLFFCVRWGMGGGFIACFAFGVLQVFIQGAVSWGWQSILLDYVLAFGVMGIAGLGRASPTASSGAACWAEPPALLSTISAVSPFTKFWPPRRSSAQYSTIPPSTPLSTTAAMSGLTLSCVW